MNNAIFQIAFREWTEMVRDSRLRVAASLVFLLLLAAFAAGARHRQISQVQVQVAQKASRDQWLAQSDKDPHSATHFGQYAVKPLSALSLQDPGVDVYVGAALLLESHKRHEATFKPARDATALARFGELTAAVVLQLLVPLLLLLLTYSTFAEEREHGTLRQVLSLGVPPRVLALGKAVGIGTALLALLVPVALFGAGTLLLATNQVSPVSEHLLTRLLLLAGCYLVYYCFFLGIGIAISAVAMSTRTAAVTVLTLWLMLCVVLPRTAAAVARSRYPLPTTREFSDAIARDKQEHRQGRSGRATMIAVQNQLLKKYGKQRVEDLPVNWVGVGMQRGEEENNAILDRNYARLEAVLQHQDAVLNTVAFLDPVLAMRSLSMALSGTDRAAYQDFTVAAENHRRDMVRTMNDYLAYHTSPRAQTSLVGQDVWQRVPEFTQSPAPLPQILGRATVSFLALFWGSVLAVVFAAFCASRVRPV